MKTEIHRLFYYIERENQIKWSQRKLLSKGKAILLLGADLESCWLLSFRHPRFMSKRMQHRAGKELYRN